MSNPTSGDVHVNGPLSNISIAFAQNATNFIADQVFKNIPVDKQSDLYYTYDRGHFNRDEMEVRAEGTESKGAGYTVATAPFYVPLYAFHHDISDQRRANADAVLNQDREATEFVTMKALIKREKLWVSSYFVTGVWANEETGVAAAPGAGQFLQWNDAASLPIEDIRNAKITMMASTGYEPNTLILSPHVLNALLDHPDIVDRIKYGQTPVGIAMTNMTHLASLFGVERVLISRAIENTAAQGVANVHNFIAGKHALLVYSPSSPGLMTPAAGYTFSWNGMLGSSAMGGRIKRFRLELIASDRIEIEMAFVHQLISDELGFMFLNAVA